MGDIEGYPTKFEVGIIVASESVVETVGRDDVMIALLRHHCGKWGDVDEDCAAENERALIEGGPLHSTHYSEYGVKFCIVTNAERTKTEIMLEEEL